MASTPSRRGPIGPEAERIHRISRDLLETYGRPIGVVAELLLFRVSPLELILSERQMEEWHGEKTAVMAGMDPSRHRASHHAWMIPETYRRTYRAADAA